MKNKIICLGLVIVMLVSLTGCSSNVININMVTKSPNIELINFEIVDNNFYEAILVDKNTKVMYCWITCNSGGITPIYNADGSLKLYEGEYE